MLRDPIRRTTTAILVVAAGVLTACGAGPAGDAPAAAPVEVISSHTAHLDWEDSWDAAFTRARAEGKPVLVSFEADWCVWCKKLASTTYRDSAVMSLISDSLVPLSLDVDGSGRELSDEHGVDSLPTILVFDASGHERGRINGYLPPGQFFAAVTEILQRG